jgi:hypothetical protein
VGVGRGADISFTGFHPLWDKILSHKVQGVADRGRHLEGSSPYKGTAYRGVNCTGGGRGPRRRPRSGKWGSTGGGRSLPAWAWSPTNAPVSGRRNLYRLQPLFPGTPTHLPRLPVAIRSCPGFRVLKGTLDCLPSVCSQIWVMGLTRPRFPDSSPLLQAQSNFDKRDSLKREKTYKQEVLCAFWLVSHAECAIFRRIIL